MPGRGGVVRIVLCRTSKLQQQQQQHELMVQRLTVVAETSLRHV